MELDEKAKQAARELGAAINKSIEKSAEVADAIERLRTLGYEPNLMLKLEIGLQEISDEFENIGDEFDLDLTDEDLQTLRRMKIKF